MVLRTRCPFCDAKLALPSKLFGKKRVYCKTCRSRINMDDGRTETTAPAPTSEPAQPDGPREPNALAQPIAEEKSRRRRSSRRGRHNPTRSRTLRPLVIGTLSIGLVVGFILYVVFGSQDAHQAASKVAHASQPAIPASAPPPPVANCPDEIVQAASQHFSLGIKNGDVRDIITNGPSNTRAVVYFWHVAAGKLKHSFGIYDVTAGKQLSCLDLVDAQQMDLSPDGSRLAIFAHTFEQGKLRAQVSVWSLPEGTPILEHWEPYASDPSSAQHHDLLWVYLLATDRLLTVTRQGQCDVWDLQPHPRRVGTTPGGIACRLKVNAFGHTATHFAISPDRKNLAIFNNEGFSLVDTTRASIIGKTDGTPVDAPLLEPWGVTFSPDGHALNCLWYTDAKKLAVLARWSIPDGKCLSLTHVVADDGHHGGLACWGPEHVILWDGNLAEGKVFNAVKGDVCGVCHRRGDGKFVGQSQDGRLWCAAAAVSAGTMFLTSVTVPQSELAQAKADRHWYMVPAGLTRRASESPK